MTEAISHSAKEVRRAKRVLSYEISRRLKARGVRSGIISQQQRQDGFHSFPTEIQEIVRDAARSRLVSWLDDQALQIAFEEGVRRAGLKLVM